MTALKEFDRLETGGVWRENATEPPRDVTVSFGNATLVIADTSGVALTHWSLPALVRLNPREIPARYAPDIAATDVLELDDTLMIDAIEKVRSALIRARPKPGRLRFITPILTVCALVAAGVFWLPEALTRQTLSIVPLSKRSEIGATILGHYQRLTGATCRGADGTRALAQLKSRLLGAEAPGQIVVVQTLPQGAVTLPGGITLVDRALIEQHDDIAVVSGYIIAANSDRNRHDPLAAILYGAGLQATVTLYTTGDLPPEVLQAHAQTIAQTSIARPSDADLIASFDAARVPTTPYAQAYDPNVAATAPLLADDPLAGAEMPVILPDRDWVRLQGICTP